MRIGDWRTALPLELKRQLAEFERYVRLKLSEFASSISTLTAANQNIGETIDNRVESLLIGDKGDITVTGSGDVWTIDPGAVTHAQMVNVAGSRLIGNPTGAPAVRSEIPVNGTALFDLGLYFNAGSLVAGTSFLDSTFRIRDTTDPTKVLQFQVDGLQASTTRTIYPPNADCDLRMGFAYVYEDFLTSAVTTTASTNNTPIGQVMFINALGGTWFHVTAPVYEEHPGLLRLGLPATIGACAGVMCAQHESRGGEWLWVCFRTGTTFSNLTSKIGFFEGSAATTAEPTDGVYLWQTAGTGTFGFRSANASARTAGSTALLTVNTFYTLGIRMNDARTSCDCLLLDDTGATVLGYALTTTLPPVSAALYAQASVSTSAAAAVANALNLDMIRVRLGSPGNPLGRPVPSGEWSI